jgi:transcriptional regulator with XRE-family HTH domain
MYINDPFRDRLSLAREAAGLNMSELARRLTEADCPVTPQAVHAWETGINVPRRSKMTVLAKVLGVSARWLIMGEGTMHDLPSTPPQRQPTELAGLLSVGERSHLQQETQRAQSAWLKRLAEALPPTHREYLSPAALPPGGEPLDYLSPTVAAYVARVPGTHLTDNNIYASLIRLLVAGTLAAYSGQRRRMVLLVTDTEGISLPRVPSRLAWEAQTLGVDLAPVLTPEEAAAAILATE